MLGLFGPSLFRLCCICRRIVLLSNSFIRLALILLACSRLLLRQYILKRHLKVLHLRQQQSERFLKLAALLLLGRYGIQFNRHSEVLCSTQLHL